MFNDISEETKACRECEMMYLGRYAFAQST
jgi:hypothetical protein